VSGVALAWLAPAALSSTCAGSGDPREAAQHAQGAAIGTVQAVRRLDDSLRRVMLTVRVDTGFKGVRGDTLEVRTTSDEAGCGLGLGPNPVGAHFSQFVHRARDGVWETGLCERVTASQLRRATRPLPAVTRGRAAVVLAGAFGRLRSIALAADGRPVGYGRADGEVFDSAMCPGGRRFVEAVLTEGAHPRYELAVRTLPRLTLVRRLRLPGARTLYPADLSCTDALARRVLVLGAARAGPKEVGRVLAWSGHSLRRIWKVPATLGVFAGGRLYLVPDARQRVEAMSLSTGRRTRLPKLPGYISAMAADGAGRFAAEVNVTLPRGLLRTELVVFDPSVSRTRLRVRRQRGDEGSGNLAWAGRARLVYQPFLRNPRVYDSALHRIGLISDAHDPGVLVVRGRTVYMVSDGKLRTGRLPKSAARTVRRLPVSEIRSLVAAPQASASDGRAAAAACASWSRVARVTL
jgi:hypothetical protein